MIPGIVETGRRYGMQTMRQAIIELAAAGMIDCNQVADENELGERSLIKEKEVVNLR